ncbi:MerR family transcriptional regulator [Oenococcus sp. UCMA 17063]|nr:MerR family transcriptional regulator [Oenococcus sp. UCMA 17063]
MTYTIKQAAKKSGLSASSLRYYDKKGLLPFVSRNRIGYRDFTDSDLKLIHTICCLKNTGMKIRNIRRYVDEVMAGPDTIPDRVKLLGEHRARVLDEQRKIAENLNEIDYKLNRYRDPDAIKKVNADIKSATEEKISESLSNSYLNHI